MSRPAPSEPHDEYRRRLAERQQAVEREAARDARLSTARGLVFLAGLVLLAVVYGAGLSPWWLAGPGAVFVGLVIAHGPVVRRLERSRQAVRYHETALERLDGRWIGVGPTGERYASADHPYASDLDLFGRGSLFQFLTRARTRLGEDRLASWLLAPSHPDEVRGRQQAVDELRFHLDLRERLALLEAEAGDEIDQNELLRWAAEPPQPVGLEWRIAGGVLTAVALAGLVAWLVFGARISVFLVPMLVQVCYVFAFRRQVRHVVGTIDRAGSGLAVLVRVLRVLERQRFESPALDHLALHMEHRGRPPSRHIARLHRLIQSLNNSLQNQFFAPIAFLFCLPVHLVHAIETWRAAVGPHIPLWLDAVGEFEALSSLAGYAYEHPHDPFPELVEGGPLLEGEQLAHPLLLENRAVRNDLSLGGDVRLILISGSNMSGKSTMLRTVGTNAVLALAGAPVRAQRLRLSLLLVGTAMRINDSLLDGRSLFYSVVARLKQVVDLAGHSPPLLFLLDEILQGTNSHDRRVGAEGVIRRLVEDGAIGLVTTHDLALTEIVESLGSQAVNRHFEDHLTDGRMTFDYRIRPGVVQKSNALELMRMMGLDV